MREKTAGAATRESFGFVFEQPCPVRDILDRIGDQWSLLTLDALNGRTRRFNELLRDIEDISKQMLSKTLKRLEQDGFVRRTVFAEVPPRVEYALTGLGRSFLEPLKHLVGWADAHHKDIVLARRRYAAPDGIMAGTMTGTMTGAVADALDDEAGA